MIKQLTKATLAVRDQDAALSFFVDKLGFTVRTDAKYGEDERWLEIEPPGGGAGIILDKVTEPSAYQEHMAGILLDSDDVAATAEELRAKGVEVTDPETQHWGTFILVTEPDGRKICITQA